MKALKIAGIIICIMTIISSVVLQIAGVKVEPWLVGVWASCCLFFWIEEKL